MHSEDRIGLVLTLVTVVAFVVLVAAMIQNTHQLEEGIVVNKTYKPKRYVWQGKLWRPDDEDWCLSVEGVTDEGEQRKERWEVSETLYHLIDVGDSVVRIDGQILLK